MMNMYQVTILGPCAKNNLFTRIPETCSRSAWKGLLEQSFENKTQDMPPKFNFGGGEKCAICNKSVYAAERIEAGKRPFHKFCFKCSECKLQLKVENYGQADGILYCKKHYGECVVAKNTQTPTC